jgi:hypothetical protein
MRYRRIMVAVAAGGLVAGTSLVSGVVTSSAAAAAKFPVTSFTIDSSNVKVVSSTHHKLRFFVFVSRQSSGPANAVKPADSMSIGLSSGAEAHDWDFGTGRSATRLSARKGTGRIATKHELGRFGKLKLTIAPAGKAHRTCAASTGFTSTRNITLTGKPTFNSKSGKHGWGTVGKHKLTLKGSLSVDFGMPDPDCGHILHVSCPKLGLSLGTFEGDTDMNAFSRSGHASRIFADRFVDLPSPTGARRSDFLSGKLRPLSAATDTSGNITVRLRPKSKTISGSATVTGQAPPSTDTCKKVSSDDYSESTWTNGAKKLAVHGQIESAITIKNNDGVDVEVTTPRPPA